MQTRFARFQNVPELLTLYRQVADVRTTDDLDLPTPTLAGGQAETVVVEPERRARRLRRRPRRAGRADPQPGGRPGRGQHAQGHRRRPARRARPPPRRRATRPPTAASSPSPPSASPRSTTPPATTPTPTSTASSPSDPAPSSSCSATSPPRPAPAGTPTTSCATQLVRRGVDPGPIRFMHEAQTDAGQGQAVRRLPRRHASPCSSARPRRWASAPTSRPAPIALHHLDCPWRPADIEQRDGRILRQGNQNPEVQVLRYVTEGSFDTYMWQTLERKAAFIAQVDPRRPPRPRGRRHRRPGPLLRRGQGARHRRPARPREGRRSTPTSPGSPGSNAPTTTTSTGSAAPWRRSQTRSSDRADNVATILRRGDRPARRHPRRPVRHDHRRDRPTPSERKQATRSRSSWASRSLRLRRRLLARSTRSPRSVGSR